MYDNPDQPLSDDELDWLDDFLCTRFDEIEFDADKDVGIFDTSALDGYLTAIVSGPEVIPPSQWLPGMDGDYETIWESEEHFQHAFSLLVRHMNSIADSLMIDADNHQPLFMQRQIDGEWYTVVDEWCEGFVRGIGLNPQSWNLDDEEMKAALSSILVFASEQGLPVRESASDEAIDYLQQQIPPSVAAIHRYWLTRRSDVPSVVKTFRHEGSRPGRNDPCPCGSGKKYKKCCLH
jgi:uncharacterized protein